LKSYSKKLAYFLIIILPLAAGCRRSALDRLPVHGTVTLPSGEKLNGSITFAPIKGQSGPSATGKVIEGAYKFDRTDGPTAGPHNVSLHRVVSRAKMMEVVNKKEPQKTNGEEWTSSADLIDDGTYIFDINIPK
jgi:hypothetical protein